MRLTVRLKSQDDQSEHDAELFDDVTLAHFEEAQKAWRPILLAAARALKEAGNPTPRYVHWDWRTKSRFLDRLDVTFFAIRCNGQIQGLMKADAGGVHRCRLAEQKGRELVYVDYVETAPWNIPLYMEALQYQALYSRVGTRLMQAAVQLSLQNELKGRVGLHSLPDAERFYSGIGMTALGVDPDKQNLMWFEFSSEAAQNFMEKVK